MKNRFFFSTFIIAFLNISSAIFAADLLVPGQYSTIQAAINAAQPEDTVIVSPATYTGTGNRDIDFAGKAITVQSTNPDDPCVVAATIIDCQNVSGHRGFYFHSAESSSAILSGFTIKRGYTTDYGGGIYCNNASPTILNCIITANKTESAIYVYPGHVYGGGIFCTVNSSPVISNCTISNNYAKGGDEAHDGDGANAHGGGIYCSVNSSPVISNCTINNNYARGGNGLDQYCSPLHGCFGPGDGGYASGGGIYAGSDCCPNY